MKSDDRPLLRLGLVTPCTVDRSRLAPAEAGGLYCPKCDKVVRDLRRATAEELDAVAREGGRVCARITPSRRSKGLVAGAALLAAAWLGCDEDAPTSAPPPVPVDPPEEVTETVEVSDGKDHEAHPGEDHTNEHTLEHGSIMGAVAAVDPERRRRRGMGMGMGMGDDPLEGLDGI